LVTSSAPLRVCELLEGWGRGCPRASKKLGAGWTHHPAGGCPWPNKGPGESLPSKHTPLSYAQTHTHAGALREEVTKPFGNSHITQNLRSEKNMALQKKLSIYSFEPKIEFRPFLLALGVSSAGPMPRLRPQQPLDEAEVLDKARAGSWRSLTRPRHNIFV